DHQIDIAAVGVEIAESERPRQIHGDEVRPEDGLRLRQKLEQRRIDIGIRCWLEWLKHAVERDHVVRSIQERSPWLAVLLEPANLGASRMVPQLRAEAKGAAGESSARTILPRRRLLQAKNCYESKEEGDYRTPNSVVKRAVYQPGRERKEMKRLAVALGILWLVSAVSLPRATAQPVLCQDHFDAYAFLKASTTYMQGVSTSMMGDDTLRPFYIRNGKLTSNAEDGSGAASDGTGANHIDDDPPGVPFQILFGDKSWADVSIQARVYS